MHRSAAVALLLAVSASPAFAQREPQIVVPGRPDVPVIINGIDASWGIVEGEFGLDRPGAMAPVVIYRPLEVAISRAIIANPVTVGLRSSRRPVRRNRRPRQVTSGVGRASRLPARSPITPHIRRRQLSTRRTSTSIRMGKVRTTTIIRDRQAFRQFDSGLP
jgi:hypothetical protein